MSPAHPGREAPNLVDAQTQRQGREIAMLAEIEEVVADGVDVLG